MTKAARQAVLLRVIRDRPVRTQDELAAALKRRGIRASQVTLSRDLRELSVVKTPAGYREALDVAPSGTDNELTRVLREFLLEVLPAATLVVLKTRPGGAAAVALALDRVGRTDVVGTVAGDDTIFVATESAAKARKLARELDASLRGA